MGKSSLAKLIKAGGAAPQSARQSGANAASGHKRGRQQSQKGHAAAVQHAKKGKHVHGGQQASMHADHEAAMLPEVEVPRDGASAYQALVGMLSSGRSHTSRALRQQQRRAVDSDSEGSDMEDGEQDDEDMSGSEEDGSDLDEGQDEEGEKEGDVGEDEKGEEDAAGSEEEEEGDVTSEDAEEQQQQNGGSQAAHEGKVQGNGTAFASATEPAVDTWALHVERQLADTDVAALEAGTRPKYADVDYPDIQGSIPDGKWQAAGRCAALQAPASLTRYSVKERLISRWREVHADEQGHAHENGAANGSAAAGSGKDTTGTGPNGAKAEAAPARKRPGKKAPGQEEEGAGPLPGAPAAGDFADDVQRALFAALHSYSDVVVPCRAYPTSMEDPDPYLDAYLLHALNHVTKAADRIKRGNERLAAAKRAAAEAGPSVTVPVEEVPRDQGFTRPKVLLLLPQRNTAFKAVRQLVALAMRESRADSVQGKERFVEQFTDPEDDDMDEGAAARRALKPAEWRALFSGNTDDHFRMGIRITRGAIKLFSDLYQSDIIVASPIAIATKLAEDAAKAAGKDAGAGGKRAAAAAAKAKAAGSAGDGAADFLSSIELLVVDRADVLSMQNWQHVETVVAALNQLPKEQHGVDIMRLREWYLSGWARHFRQTVLLTSFMTPDMNALLGGPLCANHAGKLRVAPHHTGVLGQVVPQVQQVFERFTTSSPAEVPAARFEYFKRVVWPRLREGMGANGLLLFVPHYFDFVRLRNFLKAEDEDVYEAISEYTEGPDVTAARSRFFHRRVRILLYTERAHFYHRHRLRGIKDVLFYSPPEHAVFYPELLNLLEDAGSAPKGGGGASALAHHSSVGLLFCKWDVLTLERLVGSSRCSKMLKAQASTFMFC